MVEEDLLPQRLRDLVAEKAVLHGGFTLVSGFKSTLYFDLKRVLCWPEGAYLIGEVVFQILKASGFQFVGGYGLGGHLMTAAIVTASGRERNYPISGFEVRDEGIKGHLPPIGGAVAVVDDVLTTGKSILKAIEVIEATGRRVGKVIPLLDRQQGGEDLRRRYDVVPILLADASGGIRVNN